MERPYKERPAMKGKANLKQNCTSCQPLSVTPADTVMLCKKTPLISEKLVGEYKCYQEHCITCTFTLMQTTEEHEFSRLRLYFTPAGTQLLCLHVFATYY